MKLKLLVKLGELILGKSFDEERADMYLPVWLLAFGIVLLLGAVAFGVAAIVKLTVGFLVAALVALGLGITALLCWKNQTIVVLSDSLFEYTTFLGNKKTYAFKDITGLVRNRDSMTLLVGGERVHIESCAILSKRLVDSINKELEALSQN